MKLKSVYYNNFNFIEKMKFGKIGIVIIGLILTEEAWAIKLKEKGINFEDLGSKLGNLTFVALNKSKSKERI